MEKRFQKANLNRPPLTYGVQIDKFQMTIGGLAQLGERQAGSLKVTGSSPVSSTFSIMLEIKPQIDGAFFVRVAREGRALHRREINCHNL